MNQMVRIICHPYLSFPGNAGNVPGQVAFGWESRYEYDAILNRLKQLPQLNSSLGVHRTMAGNRLNQHKPSIGQVIENCIGHFAMRVNNNTQ